MWCEKEKYFVNTNVIKSSPAGVPIINSHCECPKDKTTKSYGLVLLSRKPFSKHIKKYQECETSSKMCSFIIC